MPRATDDYKTIIEGATNLRVAEIVAALSQALDLGAGATRWHSVRTCILGMRIAHELHLPFHLQTGLFYALLLKDAGCSSNASDIFHTLLSDDIAAKRDVKQTDWSKMGWESVQYALTHVATGKPFLQRVRAILRVAVNQDKNARRITAIRCERGSTLARLMGLPEETAKGIAALDEQWNGRGNPDGLAGEAIPIASRIMLLAQTLDIFCTSQGPKAAIAVAKQRSGKWFDPQVVKAATRLAQQNKLWLDAETEDPMQLALLLDPEGLTLRDGHVSMDAVCQAFGQIVDAKSPFTFNHSNGVANAAVAIARKLGLPPARVLFLRHAGLLHDLGKMSVSNSILEKPGKPDAAEWQALKAHPAHTAAILECITGFAELSYVAASHHEKLNGTGYHQGLTADQLSTEARILVVADIFDALSAKRPYRDALPLEKVFDILRKDVPHALDGACVEALQQSGAACDQSFVDLEALQSQLTSYNTQSRSTSPAYSRADVPAA